MFIHCTAKVLAAHGVVALCIEKNKLQSEPDKAPNLGQSGRSDSRAGETLTIRGTNTHDLHSNATFKKICARAKRTDLNLCVIVAFAVGLPTKHPLIKNKTRFVHFTPGAARRSRVQL